MANSYVPVHKCTKLRKSDSTHWLHSVVNFRWTLLVSWARANLIRDKLHKSCVYISFRMLLGPGVQLVQAASHDVGVEQVMSSMSPVAVVDTYYRNTISTPAEVLRAIIDMLVLPEWYGYEFAQLIVSYLAQPLHFSPPGPFSPTAAGAAAVSPTLIIVLVLRPALYGLVHEPQLLRPLIEAHELGRRRGVALRTIIFKAPITSKSRL